MVQKRKEETFSLSCTNTSSSWAIEHTENKVIKILSVTSIALNNPLLKYQNYGHLFKSNFLISFHVHQMESHFFVLQFSGAAFIVTVGS